ncbi:hypothetical protein ACWKWQ_20250, partial [Arthrobacter sp. MAHUQ-56]
PARKLLAEGADSFYRVLVDPRYGAPLEIGRRSYRLPETITRWIWMRDRKCTFPGCNNLPADNESDPLQAWHHDGTTGVSNLGQLCPKHHRLKHNSGWTLPGSEWDRAFPPRYDRRNPCTRTPRWRGLGKLCGYNMLLSFGDSMVVLLFNYFSSANGLLVGNHIVDASRMCVFFVV